MIEYALGIVGGVTLNIGISDQTDVTLLSPPTNSIPTQFPVTFDRGNGSTAGHGIPQVIWQWDYLNSIEIALLRDFHTVSTVLQKSRAVWLRTRKPDDPTEWGYYTAWSHWPQNIEQNRQPNGLYINVQILFTTLEDYTP